MPHERYGGCEINFKAFPSGLNRNYKEVRNPSQNASFSHYRLGALGEQLCDSTVSTTTPQENRNNPALFPNPASTTVHIVTDKPVRSCIVFNTAGQQESIEWSQHTYRITLHTAGLPAGLYVAPLEFGHSDFNAVGFVVSR